MDVYVDPGLAAHAQGLELRIIDLTAEIGRARRWPGRNATVAQLRARRRALLDELATTTATMAETRVTPVEIDARPVRPADREPARDASPGGDRNRRTA